MNVSRGRPPAINFALAIFARGAFFSRAAVPGTECARERRAWRLMGRRDARARAGRARFDSRAARAPHIACATLRACALPRGSASRWLGGTAHERLPTYSPR